MPAEAGGVVDHCRHAHAIPIELKDLSLPRRLGLRSRRRRHMVVATPMFVVRYDEQRLSPEFAGADAIVHISNKLLAERDDRWRVLVPMPRSGCWLLRLSMRRSISHNLKARCIEGEFKIKQRQLAQRLGRELVVPLRDLG
jgi:hypothetical protein